MKMSEQRDLEMDEKYCRTCLIESNRLISLFENNLADMLLACTSINVTNDDGSKMICECCKRLINDFYTFRTNSIDNQKLIQRKMEIKLEPEIEGNTSPINLKEETKEEEFSEIKKVPRKKGLHIENQFQNCNLCPFCEKSVKRLRKHVQIEHANVELTCKICDRQFKNPRSFILHAHSMHPVSSNTKSLNRISEKFKKGNRDKCTICARTFSLKATLKAHMDRHAGIDPRPICYICGKKFHNVDLHVKKAHVRERVYKCRYCNRVYGVLNELRKHHKAQHGFERQNEPMRFECNLCEKKFLKSDNLYHHVNSQHNDKRPFACSVCDKCFKTKQQLTNHNNVHADIRPFPCEFCEQKFRQRSTLKIHMRRHTGERPFACHVCPRTFSQRTQYKRHVTKVHGAVPINGEIDVKTTQNSLEDNQR